MGHIIWYTVFCISKCHTWYCEVWWKINCINHLLFPCFVYVYTGAVLFIQCRSNVPSWIDMGWPIQAVYGFYICNHTGSRVSNGFFLQKNIVLCGIGQIICGRSVTGRAYLGFFLLLVEHGTKVSGYSWCQIWSNPTQNYHLMSVFSVLCYLIK